MSRFKTDPPRVGALELHRELYERRLRRRRLRLGLSEREAVERANDPRNLRRRRARTRQPELATA